MEYRISVNTKHSEKKTNNNDSAHLEEWTNQFFEKYDHIWDGIGKQWNKQERLEWPLRRAARKIAEKKRRRRRRRKRRRRRR